MSYVRLDCNILDSSLWPDKDARDIFLTALLMAVPHEVRDKPALEIATKSIESTGFSVPPGWYGKVNAAGPGIIARTGIERSSGMAALERLASPDPDSRSSEWEGRRLVRVQGGFIVLNYDKYRHKDHSAAERQARYRANKALRVTTRNVTQALSITTAKGHKTGPLSTDERRCLIDPTV